MIVTLRRRTREHSEDGGEGVELEAVDDIAGVDELQTHEAEANHQQHDVEQLRHQRQPQHPCTATPRSGVSLLFFSFFFSFNNSNVKDTYINKETTRSSWSQLPLSTFATKATLFQVSKDVKI